MKKRFRLTRQSQFQRLLEGRRLFTGRSMIAFAQPNGAARPRVGVAVSRQVRGAVDRNRARRRLREAARRRLLAEDWEGSGAGIPYDMVLIARPGALTLPMLELEAEASAFREKLNRL